MPGTTQYPGTTVAQRRAYWAQIENVFEGRLVDASHGPLSEVALGFGRIVASRHRSAALPYFLTYVVAVLCF